MAPAVGVMKSVAVRCRVLKQSAFFGCFAPEVREILNDGKYATDGELQFTLPGMLKAPPISQNSNANQRIDKFGGAGKLRNALK